MSTLVLGDCLEKMKDIPSQSINLVLADLPYGTTANKWDSIIDLDRLWAAYLRVATPSAAIVLTASQPFTSRLVMSRPELLRHEWIWIKNRGSNFANTVREPFKEHESVLVFSRGKWTYNRQMQERTGGGVSRIGTRVTFKSDSSNYRAGLGAGAIESLSEMRVPSSWQKFNTEVGLHPTQKPVELMRYLIRTYSNPGDTVLDNTMGSGTTGVAAVAEGREFIGIELDPTYFAAAQERIHAAAAEALI